MWPAFQNRAPEPARVAAVDADLHTGRQEKGRCHGRGEAAHWEELWMKGHRQAGPQLSCVDPIRVRP